MMTPVWHLSKCCQRANSDDFVKRLEKKKITRAYIWLPCRKTTALDVRWFHLTWKQGKQTHNVLAYLADWYDSYIISRHTRRREAWRWCVFGIVVERPPRFILVVLILFPSDHFFNSSNSSTGSPSKPIIREFCSSFFASAVAAKYGSERSSIRYLIPTGSPFS